MQLKLNPRGHTNGSCGPVHEDFSKGQVFSATSVAVNSRKKKKKNFLNQMFKERERERERAALSSSYKRPGQGDHHNKGIN